MNRFEEMSRGALIREVEALEGKVATLRDAMGPFVDRVPLVFMDGDTSDKSLVALAGSPLGDYRRARAAYEATK